MPKIIKDLKKNLKAEARRQVMEGGYESMSVRSVAKVCKVGVGTVYNYYCSKDDLIAGFLAEDWQESLERVQVVRNGSTKLKPVLETLYTELDAFAKRFGVVFYAAKSKNPTPPRQYHESLRAQISKMILPYYPDVETADFVAESLITWSVEGRDFTVFYKIVSRLAK